MLPNGGAQAKTSFLMHARGIEHQTKGVENVSACINLVLATGRIGKPYCGYATITGQGNGQGGREHGHKCDQLPGNRDIENPDHRRYISEVWGIDEKELPGKGLTAYELMQAIQQGEIKGLISICFNPVVSLPNNNMIREALEKLEFYCAIDFFLNETAHYADIVLAGSLHEEEEGTVTTAEGRVTRIRQAVTPPGEARTDTEILLELARRLGAGKHFPSVAPRIFSTSCGSLQKAARPIISGSLTRKSRKTWASSGLAPASIIQARRACGKTANSGHPMAKGTSFPSPTAIPAKWLTRIFQLSSRPVVSSPNISAARKLVASGG